jgi:hypothetical protein
MFACRFLISSVSFFVVEKTLTCYAHWFNSTSEIKQEVGNPVSYINKYFAKIGKHNVLHSVNGDNGYTCVYNIVGNCKAFKI